MVTGWLLDRRNFPHLFSSCQLGEFYHITQRSVFIFFTQKMYQPSKKKVHVSNELRTGKDFQQLSKELALAKATAEVYGIDCLAAGMEMDHEIIARYLHVPQKTSST